MKNPPEHTGAGVLTAHRPTHIVHRLMGDRLFAHRRSWPSRCSACRRRCPSWSG
uniref:Uncharacterized protein n=1 Tax=Zea mays TaxID=4577 RepID=C4J2R1_MAIZE|nr:unknown [Zea mays]